jgi:ATP-binding cassette subfamily B protein
VRGPGPGGGRPPRAAADGEAPGFTRTTFRDLFATLGLVWEASPKQGTLLTSLSLLLAFMPAVTLYISKLLLDAVAAAINGELGTVEQAFGSLLLLLALQLGVTVLVNILSTAQAVIRELLGDALQNRISLRILRKAAQLDLAQFEDPTSYDALQNAYREVGVRPLQVYTQVLTLVQAVITLASVAALMIQLGPLVVPLVLLGTIPGVWVSSKFGTEGYRMLRRQAEDARVQNYLGRLLTDDTAVKEIRLFDFGDYLLQRWNMYYERFRAQLVTLIRKRSGWGLAASLFQTGAVGGATVFVLRRAAAGGLTVGDFGLFIQGIVQLQNQFANLLSGFTGIYQNLLYMRNLYEFLELPVKDQLEGEEWAGPIDSIEFRNVSFRYPLTDRDVLKSVSFRIAKGQALALVGANGAGKTTIVKLLTRLYEPTSGIILVNGQDVTRFSPASVRREMSIIFQDFGQYQMSVKENVALGLVTELTDLEPVRSAAGRGGAAEFIEELPEQYENMLGRWFAGGQNLSGGQWQRLALARLYYRDGSVLIFDEPTAALDANAEFEVVESLRAQSRDRITVIISHRFSTVRLADHIVVLEGGVITEAGDHAQLLAAGGTYAQMFNLQARGYQQ